MIYTALNGQTLLSGQKEVLTVVTGCQVGWMPYTAGDVIPKRAVVGGILASGSPSGTDSFLYVIRGQVSGSIVIGYYDSNIEIGYVELGGVQVLTEMEMLVEAWLIYLNILLHYQIFHQGPLLLT